MINKVIHSGENMNTTSKIFISGHHDMVGSAIKRNFESKGHTDFITCTPSEFNPSNQQAVDNFFETKITEYAF